MLMSCPVSALVAGVKIGSGRRSDSRSPGGSWTPQTRPSRWYSFQPEPDRYPRATHSTGIGFVRRTSMERPASSAACGRSDSGYSPGSVEIMWLPTICPVRSNQNADNCVRTRPLSGTAEPSTTSYAEIRSVATMSRCSPTSYMSRTLPRRCTAMPSRDVSKTEAMMDDNWETLVPERMP